MEQSGFIVGIDLGTSKIVGVVGRKNEQGVISILASESIPSDSCVKYGVIYNIDEAAGKIKKLINLLENKTGKKIGKAYVSVAGKSLRAIEHKETKLLDGTTPITFALLDNLEQQAKLNKPEFFTNYSVLAPEYYLDGNYEEDPIDKIGSTLEGHYRLVIGRPNIKTSLAKSITEKAQIEIAGYIVGPVAAGALVLDEHDRQAGCALVDFGAGTTTLSIYKGGLLRFMSVIPFGGRTITKDVQELGFVFESAETYKIRYGRLGKDKNKAAADVSPDVDLRELNKVIQLRQDEIILNVINQIKLSGYADELDAGIIMIGGASQMNGLVDHLAEKSQLPVKRAVAKRVYINNAAELLQNPLYTQALSLLLFANENCEKKEIVVPKVEPVVTPTPPPVEEDDEPEEDTKRNKKHKKQKDGKQTTLFGFFEKIQNFGGTMFNDEE
ncbi:MULTISPECIES: cell division protein FtsA [unclassified Dysgonomonas]|jgi:cell division protein FtsA|uniref:cell division protein FtsA n=1 Tax=unclassified Dysgonomonas TaxID=2630389 RepID=UPI0025BBA306|nr:MULTISPECIES: cell division protein FtsA [unclassified Dysgonomonas]MDR2003178.1 cell division protein FtsA [Prevotella sp.]HMM02388.1 cell division protein FtsA [Dysgonomonas sp.]